MITYIVCYAYDGGENHRSNPWKTWEDRPGETEESDGKAGGGVEQEPQPGLVLRFLVVGIGLSFFDVAADGGDEGRPGDAVAHPYRDEGETDLHGGEAVLFVDDGEGLDEHEDQGVGEAGEEAEDEDDGFGEEHAEGPDPGLEDFFDAEAFAERGQFVRTPDVGVGVFFAATFGDAVHHYGCAGLGDGEGVEGLDGAAEDELDPDRPSVGRFG